jgi:hypothetical protein
MRGVKTGVWLVISAVILTGCVAEKQPEPDPAPLTSRTVLPSAFLTVASDVDPVANAIAASQALYDKAEFVVTAPAGDLGAQVIASSAAVALGVPLLLTPSSESSASTAALDSELDRLGATSVLDVGGNAPGPTEGSSPTDTPRPTDAPDRLQLDGGAAALNEVLPDRLEISEVASEQGVLAAVAGLGPAAPRVLSLAGDANASGSSDAATDAATDAPRVALPRVRRATPVVGAMALAVDDVAQVAPVATARAAGVPVRLVPADQPNPQASADLVTALGEAQPSSVLLLGAPFATETSLDWKLRSAITGVQLPGGGQLLFPGHLFVALYGTPGAPILGVLGEQGLPESISRAQSTTAPYAALTDRTVVPMMEIIATVAAGEAGPDGNYSNEISVESLLPWVEAAGAAGMYVVLDLQPGRTDFLSQAKLYESLLALPHVGLALDPEWRLAPNQRHLTQIGSVDVVEVNSVITWLADLTAANALPQKMLVLHQFQSRMIANRSTLDTTRDELALLIHVDGQGSQPAKQSTWNALHTDAPPSVAWGWKNFYDEDLPPLTPEQTMTQVAPTPDLITYQ